MGFSFDGWGNVTDFDQDHNSVVNGDAYELAHAYAKATGGRQTVRRSGTTLPNGDALTYSYSASGGAFDDALSRVSGISHGATAVVRYAYDGAGFVSRTTMPTISMVNGTTTPTLGTWVGLDRHNRPIIWKWYWSINSNVTAYDEELGWDRANNVLWRKDHFHDGFDVAYDIDELNRVTRAEEGTVTAGAITATSRDQQWTLDHLGNWGAAKLDLDGDGLFTGTDELDEARTHNTVNELLARDIDNDSTDDFTQTYDALGNLTDDGQNYTYTWDAFGRLREIRNRSTTDLVQELRYNGLGFLIAEHYDADEDGDVDGSDPWYHHVWDERWRLVATFRAGDSDPKEQYVLHNAGFDGRGGSSYINDVVLRDRDANTAWDAAADGTLEERLFYLTNWRHDVVALLDSSRRQVEHTRYSAYGTPFAMPAGDTDSDGDCDATDIAQIDTWIAGSIYDLRGDLNLDGVVNATDKSIATGNYQGTTLGRGAISSHGNRLRWAGMQDLLGAQTITHVRNRAYSAELGRWLSRDPLGYVDGMSVYSIVSASLIVALDPTGLHTWGPGASGGVHSTPSTSTSPFPLSPPTTDPDAPPPVKKKTRKAKKPPRGKIPPCPEIEPQQLVTSDFHDGWCRDCWSSHPGSAACFRSYGTGTNGGQQCCYDEGGVLITSGPGAGTIDRFGPSSGEVGQGGHFLGLGAGCCIQWYNPYKIWMHVKHDVKPWESDPAKYDGFQQDLRDNGVPSGTPGEGEFADGITDVELSLELTDVGYWEWQFGDGE